MASPLVTWGIPGVGFAVLIAFLYGVRSAAPRWFPSTMALGLGWVVLWGTLAQSGVLARFDLRPPPMALLFLVVLATGIGIGLSPLGRTLASSLPLWTLVGFHAFRLPLELVMHQAAVEGTMPNVMSFSGYNFDIVTGISALLVAPILAKNPSPRIALLWNLLGTLLLTAIVTLALLASPMIRFFGEGQINSWVARFPFVYLPALSVVGAIAGHTVLYRRLLSDFRTPARTPKTPT